MKLRYGFVSNSSTSSFIVTVKDKDWNTKWGKNGEKRKKYIAAFEKALDYLIAENKGSTQFDFCISDGGEQEGVVDDFLRFIKHNEYNFKLDFKYVKGSR